MKSVLFGSLIFIGLLFIMGCSTTETIGDELMYENNAIDANNDALDSIQDEYGLYGYEDLPENIQGYVEGGVFGIFRTGLSIEEAHEYTSFPIIEPSFLPENAFFQGVSLFGNMHTLEVESVALVFTVQSGEEFGYIRLSQTSWENSIYADPNGEKKLCPESVSVFAGHYSGEGRGSVEIISMPIYDIEALFATPDRRVFPEMSVSEVKYGSSLYFINDEVVFTLTVFPSVPSGMVDFDIMHNIAAGLMNTNVAEINREPEEVQQMVSQTWYGREHPLSADNDEWTLTAGRTHFFGSGADYFAQSTFESDEYSFTQLSQTRPNMYQNRTFVGENEAFVFSPLPLDVLMNLGQYYTEYDALIDEGHVRYAIRLIWVIDGILFEWTSVGHPVDIPWETVMDAAKVYAESAVGVW